MRLTVPSLPILILPRFSSRPAASGRTSRAHYHVTDRPDQDHHYAINVTKLPNRTQPPVLRRF
jgi:dTDP-D-glucose 4,6-dehydratase